MQTFIKTYCTYYYYFNYSRTAYFNEPDSRWAKSTEEEVLILQIKHVNVLY